MANGRLPASLWAPGTKITRPAPRPDAVIDPQLADRLERAATSLPFTLVSAQAGSGKTTLVAAVAERLAHRGTAVAWLGLDAGDDDPAIFLELLAVVLGEAVPGGCRVTADLLAGGLTGPLAEPRRAAGVLLNDLSAAGDVVVLVLDDLHLLGTGPALDTLGALVTHAPANLHVVATTRTDPALPLARLRSQGLLGEVRASDLRFGAAQAAVLLNDHLGLDLSTPEVEGIVAAAGGWVTGVRLLARSAHTTPSAGAAAHAEDVYEYLAAEVLDAEPDDRRRFLLDTAVLDELTPAACEAVTGRSDAAGVLADVHRDHEFLVLAVDPDADMYRYHDLFRSFLGRRLARGAPDRVAKLHLLAAASAEGAARVEHLLAAGAHAEAADAIEDLTGSGFPRPVELHRLEAWIRRLPDGVVAARPRLALVLGMAAVQRGEMGAAVGPLEAALPRLEAEDDHAGRWAAIRCLHLATNDHARFGPLLGALEADPRFADLPAAARAHHHLSSAHGAVFTGRWDEVARHTAAAIELTMSTGDVAAVEVLAQNVSPLLAPAPGVLDRVASYAAWTERRFPDGPTLARLGVRRHQAMVAFLRGHLEDALASADAAAVEFAEPLRSLPFVKSTIDWVRASTHYALGQLVLAEAAGRADETDSDIARDMDLLRLAFLARIWRAQDRAEDVAGLVPAAAAAASARYGDFTAWVAAAVRAHAAWAAGDHTTALAHLDTAEGIQARIRLVPFLGSARLDRALVLHDAGDRAAALRAVADVLAEAKAGGTPGIVLGAGREAIPLLTAACEAGVHADTAAAVLGVLGEEPSPSPVPVPGTAQVLSSRELEVLRLLARGASNQDIADALFVSRNTVKTHVQRVLTKLGATSRGGAVATARSLHLV